VVCVNCGESRPLAEMYPLRGDFQTMRRGLARTSFDLRDVEAEWWCFRCMGKHHPRRHIEG